MEEQKSRNDLESCLSAVRAEVSRVFAIDGIDGVNDETPLSHLEMDSLKAVELAVCLRDRFGIPLRPATLFDAPTIKALAILVQTSGRLK